MDITICNICPGAYVQGVHFSATSVFVVLFLAHVHISYLEAISQMIFPLEFKLFGKFTLM